MIRLRAAAWQDVKKIFELSNDPEVRKQSIHTAPIVWEEHQKWFSSRIQNTQNPFYIVETEAGEFVGQVRFDRVENEIIISVSLKAEWRGKGLSPQIIRKSIETAGLTRVSAYIKGTNIPSRKAFVQAGFKEEPLIKYTFSSDDK